MNMFKRYVRAFITALRMTAAGKALQPAAIRYPNLTQWVQDGLLLVDNTLKTADANGLDEKTRQQMTLIIDRRAISMDVILRAVKHNLSLEYPMLLDTHMEHNLTTLYALNLNDQYRVSRLAEIEGLAPEIQAAVAQLAAHLQNIPSSNNP
jgi:hypothetical protein